MKKLPIKIFKPSLAILTITFCINNNIQADIKNIFFKLPLFAGYHSSAIEKSAARKKLLQLLQKKNDLENALEVNTSIAKKNSIQKNLTTIKRAIYKQEIIIGNRWSTLRKLLWSTLSIVGLSAIGFVGYQEWISKVNKIIKQKHKKGSLARQNQQLHTQNQQLQQKLTSTKQKKANLEKDVSLLKKEICNIITLDHVHKLKNWKLTHINGNQYDKNTCVIMPGTNPTLTINFDTSKIITLGLYGEGAWWVKTDTSFELKDTIIQFGYLGGYNPEFINLIITRDTLLKASLFVLRRRNRLPNTPQDWSNVGIFDPSPLQQFFKR